MLQAIRVTEYSDQYKDQIIELILHIQQNEFHIQITREDQPDLLDIVSFYQKGKGNFWVALCGDQVIGTIALLDIGKCQAALRKMFVRSDFRGSIHNTAKILLLNAIEWAKRSQIKEIYLGTTEKFLAAHRFYEKNGFVRILMKGLPAAFPVMKVDSIFYRCEV